MIYEALRRSIENYTANTETQFLAEIDEFIIQAETSIGVLVKLPAYLKDVVLQNPDPATIGSKPQYVTMAGQGTPITDFISVDTLSRDGYGYLTQKTTSFIREAYPDSTETGPPRFFSQFDDQTLLIGPTPDGVYSLPLNYVAKWPSLVVLGANQATAGQETFIASKFPTALLHASLYFANIYMKSWTAVDAEDKAVMKALGLVGKFGKGPAKNTGAEEFNSANKAENW